MQRLILTITSIIFMSINANAQIEKTVDQANGLKIGQKAPVFEAMDASGNEFILKNEIQNQPVVVIFYRGYWCPVCNKHLSQIQDSLQLILEKGVKVVAISPEKPEYLEKMSLKTGAEFTLLYDDNNDIAKAYDVNFKPSSKLLFTYNVILGADMKNTHSDDSQQLPIPATYLINKDGKIVWRQFDRDYHYRASVKEIIKAVDKL